MVMTIPVHLTHGFSGMCRGLAEADAFIHKDTMNVKYTGLRLTPNTPTVTPGDIIYLSTCD